MAEWRDIPLIGQPYESVDDVQLDRWASTIVDAVPILVENKLHVQKRPGMTPFVTVPSGRGIDGLYWWEANQCVLAVSDGRVWRIHDASGHTTELTGTSTLQTSSQVAFADDGTRCIMANGASMTWTDGSTLAAISDPDAPSTVTHVVYLDGYILALESTTGRVHFSDLMNALSWQASSFFNAESKPDRTLVLREGFRELLMLGADSVEFWINDGRTPFSRLEGSAQPYGTAAPYSVAQAGDTWIWLDHTRRLVTMTGRKVTAMSTPYDRVIQRYASVSDAIGFVTSLEGWPLYVLNFPAAQETIVLNYEAGIWTKWGNWDSQLGRYRRFRGQTYCFARQWNLHLLGDYETGVIYRTDRQTFQDNAQPIRSLIRTGHISHGVLGRKRSDCVRLHCKRGAGSASAPNPQIMMRRRIDNGAQWTSERWRSLGQVGEHEPFIDWWRNGIYKTVQYEFVHTDNSDFIIMGAQERVRAIT